MLVLSAIFLFIQSRSRSGGGASTFGRSSYLNMARKMPPPPQVYPEASLPGDSMKLTLNRNNHRALGRDRLQVTGPNDHEQKPVKPQGTMNPFSFKLIISGISL